MIRTLAFKLQISKEDRTKLFNTMREYTKAFNASAEWGFANKTWNKVENHKATYRQVRANSSLPSSLVQGARDCACESLKSLKCETLPKRKSFSAMRYNQRVIRVNLNGYATIATIAGRVKATFNIPGHYQQYLGWVIRSSTISCRRGTFYLHVSMETADPAALPGVTVLGIDRGIVNIAVSSDNRFYNSGVVKNCRARYARLRAELQSKGTRSARRKLKRMGGRERRFVTDVNHCIIKRIVETEYTVFALEDLSKIRVQKRRGREFDRKLNNWSFFQFEQFLRYKAEAKGKRVVLVDSRYTSQKCSLCGHTYKGNRNGPDFLCRSCGLHVHSDLNASRNIAHAGIAGMGGPPVNRPNATPSVAVASHSHIGHGS
ncbi:MAG TPA: transposase [Methanocella sp.]